jgi:tetratricopeptide (TPR) repeat protein
MPAPYLKKTHLKMTKRVLLSMMVCAPLFTGACTTAGEPARLEISPGKSSVANYLVGQYAVRHRYMSEAADFLTAVQQAKDIPSELAQDLDHQLFTVLAGEGRIEDAAQVAKTLNKDELLSSVVLIVEDVVKADFKSALLLSDKLSEKDLGAYVKPLIHAWVVAANGDIDKALKVLSRLKNQKGLEALYGMHSGILNEYAGRAKDAEFGYQTAMKSEGGMSLRLAELYGTFLIKAGRQAEAEKVYQDYFTAHPDSLYIQAMLDDLNSGSLASRPALTIKDGIAETLFGLASSLRSSSTRQAGLILGRLALHLKPDFPIAQILVAEILESDERLSAANAVYRSLPASEPFSWPAHLRLALNLDDMEQTDEAVQILEDMNKQYPDRLEALVTLGDILRHRERFDPAEKVYGRALALIGDGLSARHWNLLYSRAIALERLKRWDEAEPLFLKALELEPKQPFVLNYLGYSWIEMGRNTEQAKVMIEEAVQQRPRDGYIVDSLGWVLYKFKDYEKAVPHLERAVELQPSDPVINDHLGDAYWQVGRNREARFQWHRSKSLNPDDVTLLAIEEKLVNGLREVQ